MYFLTFHFEERMVQEPSRGLHGVRKNVTKHDIALLRFEQMDVADDVLLYKIVRHRNDK